MRKNWLDTFARGVERFVPDAITTAIIMLIALGAIALLLGNGMMATLDAWYRGLWMLLPFTMQMTLILLLSLILGAAPLIRRLILRLAYLPNNTTQVVIVAVLLVAFIAYLNWGLANGLGPLVAVYFAKAAERKGIKVDFLFLMATLGGAGSVWQFGLSASAPLLMATPGNFLEQTAGLMSLRSTIWTSAAIIHVLVFTVAVMIVGRLLMPAEVRPISAFPESDQLAEAALMDQHEAKQLSSAMPPLTFSQRLERSSLTIVPLCLALSGWLYLHFFVKRLSLDINAVNTTLLLVGFMLHGSVYNFTRALQDTIRSCWPIVVMYHIYAGVAGLIQFTPVGTSLAQALNPISTRYTFPFITALISTIIAVFVPTSGGQWVIQGLVTIKAAEAAGVTAQRGLLALSVGDHMGNLIAPFWAVIGAGIARVDFRLFFGYRLIFAAVWFVLGVLAFTFLPC